MAKDQSALHNHLKIMPWIHIMLLVSCCSLPCVRRLMYVFPFRCRILSSSS